MSALIPKVIATGPDVFYNVNIKCTSDSGDTFDITQRLSRGDVIVLMEYALHLGKVPPDSNGNRVYRHFPYSTGMGDLLKQCDGDISKEDA